MTHVPGHILPKEPPFEFETNKPLTVKRLIQILADVPNKDVLVMLEGCDCDGEASGAVEHRGRILLTRRVVE